MNDGRGLEGVKVVEKVYKSLAGTLTLAEAKTTLNPGRIGESLRKAADSIQTLTDFAKAGGEALPAADELVIGYEQLGKLGQYAIGKSSTLINGVEANELLFADSGKRVVAHTANGDIPVFVRQFLP